MLRKQAYFAVISFVVLGVGLSIAYFVFGFSFLPTPQPPVAQPVETKPPFLLALFLLVMSLTILVLGLFIFYVSWFYDPDKIQANIQSTSEQLRQRNFRLRHDFTNINSNVFLWQVRFLSPVMVLVGLLLVFVTAKAF